MWVFRALTPLLFGLLFLPSLSGPLMAETSDLKILRAEIQPPPDKAYIYLYRLPDQFHDYKISVDGINVGAQEAKSFFLLEVEPGVHDLKSTPTIRVAGDREAAEKQIKTEAGKVYFIENAVERPLDAPPQYPHVSASSFAVRSLKKWAKQSGRLRLAGIFRLTGRRAGGDGAIVILESLDDAMVSSRDPQPKNVTENRHGIAVIIGNRGYSSINGEIPDVEFAHNDAEAIYAYVTQTLGFREGNVIYLKDATQAQILSVFGSSGIHQGKLFNWVRPGQSDVFVYYSGHGVPGASDGRNYLLPVNADPTTVEINGYPLETLYANLAKLPARSLTVVLDACFSGASEGGAVLRNASSITLRTTDPAGLLPNGTVLSATGQNEIASWDKKAKMGLFTRMFLDGISGAADGPGFGNNDGRVILAELKTYLEDEVSYWARRHFGRKQHPQVSGENGKVLAEVGATRP